ncbi:MAG TPA: alpha/beta hydrolase [Candidatus Limnocylindrales bacterium]|jgi:pimeloyl-ACP methyl ester carboxylesterase
MDVVRSADGTGIALFDLGGSGRPVILVHGASADHTTWRVSGPILARGRRVIGLDRRGRGASGDTQPYSIEREFDDLAAAAEELAGSGRGPVDVVGHSFGGRVALGAALRTEAIRRLVVYESAPPVATDAYQPAGLVRRLRELADSGDGDELLSAFLLEVVGMSQGDLDAYRADPIWATRAAAAPTIVRELEAESAPAASLDALGGVRQPVLQVVGGQSRSAFQRATQALDLRLADGRVVTIPGARHGAHHTHPETFVAAVEEHLGPS